MSAISVALPVRDGAAHLAASLASVHAQTRAAEEIVVADGGSADGSVAVAAAHGARVVDVGDADLSSAYNAAAAATSGALLAFTAADDLWVPEKLARQADALMADPDAGACVCGAEWFCDGPLPAGFRPELLERRAPARIAETLLIRRAVWDALGGFRPRAAPAGDVDFYLRAEEAGVRIVVLADVLLRKRVHTGSNTHRTDGAMEAALLRTLHASIRRRRAS